MNAIIQRMVRRKNAYQKSGERSFKNENNFFEQFTLRHQPWPQNKVQPLLGIVMWQ